MRIGSPLYLSMFREEPFAIHTLVIFLAIIFFLFFYGFIFYPTIFFPQYIFSYLLLATGLSWLLFFRGVHGVRNFFLLLSYHFLSSTTLPRSLPFFMIVPGFFTLFFIFLCDMYVCRKIFVNTIIYLFF